MSENVFGMDHHQVRELINNKIMEIEADIVQVSSIRNINIVDNDIEVPIRIYNPIKSGSMPLIILIHGGAWVAGNLDTHDNLARYLSKNTNSIVISIGYTNSPEGKYTLILKQCLCVIKWAMDNKNDLNFNDRVSIVGDSAGGNIAIATTLMAHENNHFRINNLITINPAPDLRELKSKNADERTITFHNWQAKIYSCFLDDINKPYVSPTTSDKLNLLPPTLVILAEHDPLYDSGFLFAHKLLNAGVDVEMFTQKNVGHLAGDGARASEKAKPSLEFIVRYIHNYSKANTI